MASSSSSERLATSYQPATAGGDASSSLLLQSLPPSPSPPSHHDTASPAATPMPATMPNPMSMSASEPHPRLSIMTPSRLMLGSIASGIVGLTLGAMQGGQMAQLRFRAEHAHKMPDTTTGWYFYHKSKNYHAMQGGIREAFRMGAKTGFWSFVALGLESTVDRYRGSSDMFSTMVATLSVAGAFSLWHRFSLSTAARTARFGLLFGLAYGGVQDLVGLARGRPIGYVELVRRRFGAASRDEGSHGASDP